MAHPMKDAPFIQSILALLNQSRPIKPLQLAI